MGILAATLLFFAVPATRQNPDEAIEAYDALVGSLAQELAGSSGEGWHRDVAADIEPVLRRLRNETTRFRIQAGEVQKLSNAAQQRRNQIPALAAESASLKAAYQSADQELVRRKADWERRWKAFRAEEDGLWARFTHAQGVTTCPKADVKCPNRCPGYHCDWVCARLCRTSPLWDQKEALEKEGKTFDSGEAARPKWDAYNRWQAKDAELQNAKREAERLEREQRDGLQRLLDTVERASQNVRRLKATVAEIASGRPPAGAASHAERASAADAEARPLGDLMRPPADIAPELLRRVFGIHPADARDEEKLLVKLRAAKLFALLRQYVALAPSTIPARPAEAGAAARAPQLPESVFRGADAATSDTIRQVLQGRPRPRAESPERAPLRG